VDPGDIVATSVEPSRSSTLESIAAVFVSRDPGELHG
jgi:hypothetical protein